MNISSDIALRPLLGWARPLLFLILAACSSDSPAPTGAPLPTSETPVLGTSAYESGALREQYHYFIEHEEQVLHGAYNAFYESGALEMAGFYARGRKDSIWSFYAESGRKTLVHTWKEGQRWDGPFSLYWPNGQLSEYGIYRQGKWYGAYSSYFSSGPLEIRTQYIDDQIHGPFSEFYESGQRKVSGAYDNGFKHGRWTHYAESGLVVLREQYEHGQLIEAEHTQITTYADGTLKSTAPLTDGAIDGLYNEYWPNGNAKESTVYARGVPHGQSTTYWDSGEVRTTGINNVGKRQGLWQTFNRDGILSIKATYSQSFLTGPYASYYANGQLQWQGIYQRNKKEGLWTNYTSSGQKRLQQLWQANRLLNGIDCRADPPACE